MKSASQPSGLLVVDKPVGISSMDVVRRVRRAACGAKTGHAGTLDPLASGVLICCLGKATRCVEQLMGLAKVYEADVDLSAFTPTDDREGQQKTVEVKDYPTESAVRSVLSEFIGVVDQAPPTFSAVHVDGQRAYKLARRGKTVEMPIRQVRIDQIELHDYKWPIVSLVVRCGRGTYMRSLARDLGKRLATGGHLACLRRTAVGTYDVRSAVSLEQIGDLITQDDLLAPLS